MPGSIDGDYMQTLAGTSKYQSHQNDVDMKTYPKHLWWLNVLIQICFQIGFHTARLCSGCCVNDSSFWGLTTCQSVVEGCLRFVRLDSQGFRCYWQWQRWKSSMSTKYANQMKYDQLKINTAHHSVESNPTFEFMPLWQGIPWPTRSRPNGHLINAESFLNYLARVARPHRTRLLARFDSSWSNSKSLASWRFACISTRVSVQVLMCPQAGTISRVYHNRYCYQSIPSIFV